MGNNKNMLNTSPTRATFGQAMPMSCVSPKSGQQCVVMSAGGARQSRDCGDHVIAYRLDR